MKRDALILPLNLEFDEEIVSEFAEYIDWSRINPKAIKRIPKSIVDSIPAIHQYRILNRLVDRLDCEAVEDILKKGVSPDVISPRNNHTALAKLLEKAHNQIWSFNELDIKLVELTKLLLKYGADPDCEITEDFDPIHILNKSMERGEEISVGQFSIEILNKIKTLIFDKAHKPFS